MNPRVINNSSKIVLTTSTVISKATYGSKRLVFAIQNTSLLGEKISIAIGKAAVTGEGIVLNPNDRFTMSQDGGYIPPVEEIQAIASAATATLSVYEEIELS
jgi:hypothetical protein